MRLPVIATAVIFSLVYRSTYNESQLIAMGLIVKGSLFASCLAGMVTAYKYARRTGGNG